MQTQQLKYEYYTVHTQLAVINDVNHKTNTMYC